MRKFKFFLLLALVISMSSCSVVDSKDEKHLQNGYLNVIKKDYSWSVKGDMPDEFIILMNKNPIDTSYKKMTDNYNGSSSELLEIATTYRDWWRIEMEISYNSLLDLLDGEDKNRLIVSQSSWEEYMSSSNELSKSFFYDGTYGSFGNLRKGLYHDEEAEETKARAYTLLEYLFTITSEINLVFDTSS